MDAQRIHRIEFNSKNPLSEKSPVRILTQIPSRIGRINQISIIWYSPTLLFVKRESFVYSKQNQHGVSDGIYILTTSWKIFSSTLDQNKIFMIKLCARIRWFCCIPGRIVYVIHLHFLGYFSDLENIFNQNYFYKKNSKMLT